MKQVVPVRKHSHAETVKCLSTTISASSS